MKCQRCGGLMRLTLLREGSSYSGRAAIVCLLCGDIIHEVIIRNRTLCRARRRLGKILPPVDESPIAC